MFSTETSNIPSQDLYPRRGEDDVLQAVRLDRAAAPPYPESATAIERVDVSYYGPYGTIGERGHAIFGFDKTEGVPVVFRDGRQVLPDSIQSLMKPRNLQNGRTTERGNRGISTTDIPADGLAHTYHGFGYTLVSFPTVEFDNRPGASATFIAKGEQRTGEEVLAAAREHFPVLVTDIEASGTDIILSPDRDHVVGPDDVAVKEQGNDPLPVSRETDVRAALQTTLNDLSMSQALAERQLGPASDIHAIAERVVRASEDRLLVTMHNVGIAATSKDTLARRAEAYLAADDTEREALLTAWGLSAKDVQDAQMDALRSSTALPPETARAENPIAPRKGGWLRGVLRRDKHQQTGGISIPERTVEEPEPAAPAHSGLREMWYGINAKIAIGRGRIGAAFAEYRERASKKDKIIATAVVGVVAVAAAFAAYKIGTSFDDHTHSLSLPLPKHTDPSMTPDGHPSAAGLGVNPSLDSAHHVEQARQSVALGAWNPTTGEGSVEHIARDRLGLGNMPVTAMTHEQAQAMASETHRLLELNELTPEQASDLPDTFRIRVS